MPKTWNQKLDPKTEPHVEPLDKPMWGLAPGTMLFIATPRMVKAYVDAIPAGQQKTILQMREEFAKKHGAEYTCPMTSSIFARIVAEAALEDHVAGKPLSEISPFWRLFDHKSTVAKKLSCGTEFVQRQRQAEGIA